MEEEEGKDRRGELRALLAELNKLLEPTQIQQSELDNASADDLDAIFLFYEAYLGFMQQTSSLYSSFVSTVDFKLMQGAYSALHDELKRSTQLKTLPSFQECSQRCEKIGKILNVVGQWQSNCVQMRHAKEFFHGLELACTCEEFTLKQLAEAMESQQELLQEALAKGQDEVQAKQSAARIQSMLSKEIPCCVAHDVRTINIENAEIFLAALRALIEEAIEANEKVAESVSAVEKSIVTGKEVCRLIETWIKVESLYASLTSQLASKAAQATMHAVFHSFQSQVQNYELFLHDIGSESPTCNVVVNLNTAEKLKGALQVFVEVKAELEGTMLSISAAYPRLGFLPPGKLFEFVGATSVSNHASIQPFLEILGTSWSSLEYVDGEIRAVVGKDGERLPLDAPVTAVGSMDTWLKKLYAEIRQTMKRQYKEVTGIVRQASLKLVPFKPAVLLNYSTQVSLTALHLLWTLIVEGSLSKKKQSVPVEPVVMEHFGYGSRPQSSRPVSAAVRLSKLTSSMSPAAPIEPRPGSAAGVQRAQKGKSSEKKGERPQSAENRQSAVSLVRDKKAAWEAEENEEEFQISPHRHSSNTNRVFSCATQEEQSRQIKLVLDELCALRASATGELAKKIAILIAFQFRLYQCWLQQLQNIGDINDFTWKREPRCYMGQDVIPKFEIGPWEYSSGLEFHGKISPFVLSFAHHELWVRIATAATVHHGCIVVGSKGSGRSASVQYFALLCGVHLVALEGSNTTTLEEVKRFICAAAASGSWGLIKNIEQLPQVLQKEVGRISYCLLTAQMKKLRHVTIDGTEVALSTKQFMFFGIAESIVSVNEGLRQSYRCCYLPVPDFHFIIGGALASRGFQETESLAAKLHYLRNFCAALIQEQPAGCPLGIRNFLEAVEAAGMQLPLLPSLSEEHALLQILQTDLLPRFTASTRAILLSCVQSVFQNQGATVFYPQLRKATIRVLEERELLCTPALLSNLLFLHDAAVSATRRRPIVVIGESSCGKSMLLDTLKCVAELVNDKPKPNIFRIFHEVHSSEAMFGGWADGKWINGFVSQRAHGQISRKEPLWIVFDGKIAPEICQFALSRTVTIDGKTVPLNDGVVVFFETRSFDGITTEFASRCVVANPSNENPDEFWVPLLHTAAEQNPSIFSPLILEVMQKLCEEHMMEITLFSSHVSSGCNLSPFRVLKNFVALLTGVLRTIPISPDAAERAFWFAVSWTFMVDPSNEEWNDFVNQRISPSVASTQPIVELYVDARGTWDAWAAKKTNTNADNLEFTDDVVRCDFLASIFVKESGTVFFCGDNGLGKSILAGAIQKGTSVNCSKDIRNELQGQNGSLILEDAHYLDDQGATIVRELITNKKVDALGCSASSLIITCQKAPNSLANSAPVIFFSPGITSAGVQRLCTNLSIATQIEAFTTDIKHSTLGSQVTVSRIIRLIRRLRDCEKPKIAFAAQFVTDIFEPSLTTKEERECLQTIVKSNFGTSSTGPSVLLPSLNQLIPKSVEDAKAAVSTIGGSSALQSAASLSIIATVTQSIRQNESLILIGTKGMFQDKIISVAAALTSTAFETVNVSSSELRLKENATNLITGISGMAREDWFRLSYEIRQHHKRVALTISSLDDIPKYVRGSIIGCSQCVALSKLQHLTALKEMATEISAKNDDLISGLYHSTFDGHSSSVETYVRSVENCQKVSAQQNDELEKRIAATATNMNFCGRLLQTTQRKPVISETEMAYEPDPDQPLRAFEGTISYNEFPSGIVRLILKVTSSAEGKLNDVSNTAIFYTTHCEELFASPSLNGGLCRGRIDSNDVIVFQPGAHDFRFTMSMVEGEAYLTGSIHDCAAGGALMGSCKLKEVIEVSALSRKWLRFGGEEPSKSEDQLTQPAPLPTAEQLGQEPDEADRTIQQIGNTLKAVMGHLEIDLKSDVKESKGGALGISAMLAIPLAELSFDERSIAARKGQEWAASTWGAAIAHPCSNQVLASLLSISEEELVQWFFFQHESALPSGPVAEFVATVIRYHVTEATSLPIYVCDDADSLGPWVEAFLKTKIVSVNELDASSNVEWLVVKGVTGANFAETMRKAQVANHVMLFSEKQPSPLISSQVFVVNHQTTEASLSIQLQHAQVEVTASSPVFKQTKDGLLKASESVQHTSQMSRKLSYVVAEQLKVSQQESDVEAIVGFGGKKIADVVEELQEARQIASDNAGFVRPSSKLLKDIENVVPQCNRAAFLILKTLHTVPKLHSLYQLSMPALFQLANTVLAITPKGNDTPVDCVTKEFCAAVMKMMFDDDRLFYCAALAFFCLGSSGSVEPGALSQALRSFRSTDVNLQLDFEQRQQEALEEARVQFQQQQEKEREEKAKAKKAAPKTKEKEFKEKDYISPETKPKFSWMSYEQWVKVLALSKVFAPLSNLPASFNEETTKGASREQKWLDWFGNPIGGMPSYEKDTSINPLHKLSLVRAVRSDRSINALLNFIFEVFGSDFVNPFQPDDLSESLLDAQNSTSAQLPLILMRHAFGRPCEVDVDIAFAMKTAYIAYVKKSFQETGKDDKASKAKEKALIQSPPISLYKLNSTEHSLQNIISCLETARSEGSWVLLDDFHLFDDVTAAQILEDLAKPVENCFRVLICFDVDGTTLPASLRPFLSGQVPKFALNPPKGVRIAMLRHYAEMETMHKFSASLQSPSWGSLLFVVSYLAAVIEQRCRYQQQGFCNVKQLRRSDADLHAAVGLISKLSSTSANIPWDEIRELLGCLLGATLDDDHDRNVIQAYIDWLVHPEVILAPGGSPVGKSVILPSDVTVDAHKSAIEKISQIDLAEVVGMHSNTEKRLQGQEGDRVFAFLENLTLPISSLPLLQQQAADLLNHIPRWSASDLAMLQSEVHQGALFHYLFDEVKFLHGFLTDVRSSLSDIIAASDIESVDEDMYRSLTSEKTPSAWQEECGYCDSLPKWLQGLHARYHQLHTWAHQGRPNLIMLPLLKYPKALLSAFLHDASIESGLFPECTEVKVVVPNLNVFVPSIRPSRPLSAGLFLGGVSLDGAKLDGHTGMLTEAPDLYSNWWERGSFEVNCLHMTIQQIQDKPKTPVEISPVKSVPSVVKGKPPIEFSRYNSVVLQSRPSSASGAKAAPIRPQLIRPTTASSRRIGTGSFVSKLNEKVMSSQSAVPEIFYCPLFVGLRSPATFLADVEVPTNVEHNHWVLRGAALIASLP